MLGFCCSGHQNENHRFTFQAEKMPGMRCKEIRTKHGLPRTCLTPGLEGYGMGFSVNKGRDQYHKGTVQREPWPAPSQQKSEISHRKIRGTLVQGSQVAQWLCVKGWARRCLGEGQWARDPPRRRFPVLFLLLGYTRYLGSLWNPLCLISGSHWSIVRG